MLRDGSDVAAYREDDRGSCDNPAFSCIHPRGSTLATYYELSEFLRQQERRAFKQAQYAVRDDHAALDIVQDAMMKLAEKYADRPPEELPLLFQRILQNTIHDYYRRHKVRTMWTTLLSALNPFRSDEDSDPLETLPVENGQSPQEAFERTRTLKEIEEALNILPERQRQAFILRYWEELDVAETASVMGCSEGSVKTHCSRATHALAEILKAKGIHL